MLRRYVLFRRELLTELARGRTCVRDVAPPVRLYLDMDEQQLGLAVAGVHPSHQIEEMKVAFSPEVMPESCS